MPRWRRHQRGQKDLVACDFFTVPTVTLKVLFVFVLVAHERRRIVHFMDAPKSRPVQPPERDPTLLRDFWTYSDLPSHQITDTIK